MRFLRYIIEDLHETLSMFTKGMDNLNMTLSIQKTYYNKSCMVY